MCERQPILALILCVLLSHADLGIVDRSHVGRTATLVRLCSGLFACDEGAVERGSFRK